MVTVETPGTATEVAATRRRSAPLKASILAIAALPPLTQIAYLVVRGRASWPLLLSDDAFYYLGVARNIGEGHGSTFSGLVETNGYHPLWALVLSALAAVVTDPYTLVAVVVIIQGLLWLGVVGQALRLGRHIGSEASGILGLALLGVLAVVTGQISFNGMESAPLLFLMLLAIRLLVESDDPDDRRASLRLGLLFAAIALTRLDAVMTTVPLALIAARRGGPTLARTIRRSIVLLGPTGVGLTIYIAINLVAFGTPTPVSGQAKALGAPFLNLTPVEQFLRAGQMGERPLWFGASALAVLALAWLGGAWRSQAPTRRLMHCAVALLIGQALLLAYLTVGTSYPVWAWYHYNVALIAFCGGSLLGVWASRIAPGPALLACALTGTAFAVGQVPATFWSGSTNHPEAVETARFVDAELPSGAVIAMGDRAGLVGYLSARPMLQLEGLMADAEWLENLDDGTALERIEREGVDYYLWAGIVPAPVVLDGQACRTMSEPRNSGGPHFMITVCDGDLVFQTGRGHNTFTVWRYRAELNDP